jgi:hypothetical protein
MAMPSLREIQTGFAAALFDPACTGGAPGIRADGISPAQRLGFYRTNVFENYRKALASTYPAIERLVGPGCFAHLANAYSRRQWSRSGDVGAHAARFPDFLARHPIGRELAYLEDVARLELAIDESFQETDHCVLPLDRLAAVPEAFFALLRFELAPSVRLLRSAFPLHRIWQLSVAADDSAERVELSEGGAQLLVYREGYAVQVEALSQAEFEMLGALQVGYGFEEAFDYARAIDAEFDPARFLHRHVQRGVLCGFTLPAEADHPR